MLKIYLTHIKYKPTKNEIISFFQKKKDFKLLKGKTTFIVLK